MALKGGEQVSEGVLCTVGVGLRLGVCHRLWEWVPVRVGVAMGLRVCDCVCEEMRGTVGVVVALADCIGLVVQDTVCVGVGNDVREKVCEEVREFFGLQLLVCDRVCERLPDTVVVVLGPGVCDPVCMRYGVATQGTTNTRAPVNIHCRTNTTRMQTTLSHCQNDRTICPENSVSLKNTTKFLTISKAAMPMHFTSLLCNVVGKLSGKWMWQSQENYTPMRFCPPPSPTLTRNQFVWGWGHFWFTDCDQHDDPDLGPSTHSCTRTPKPTAGLHRYLHASQLAFLWVLVGAVQPFSGQGFGKHGHIDPE